MRKQVLNKKSFIVVLLILVTKMSGQMESGKTISPSTPSYTATGSLCLLKSTSSPFATGSTYNNPLYIANGDFNGDGILDMAVAPAYGSAVDVFLGTGGGNFSPLFSTSYSADWPSSIAVGDFNTDGKLDYVSTSAGGGVFELAKGDGTGHFIQYAHVATSQGGSVFVKVADFNHDGKQDMIAGDIFGSKLALCLGNGTGGFSAPVYYPVGYSCTSLVVADFNNDGNMDVATTNKSDGSLYVLLGNGAGALGTASTYPIASSGNPANSSGNTPYSWWVPEVMSSGDFNADGYPDLAVSNIVPNCVSVLLNNGTGGFNTPANIAALSTPGATLVQDLNADGKPDIITGSYTGNDINVFLGKGGTSFQTPFSVNTGSNKQYYINTPMTPAIYSGSCSMAMAAGDYDKNGKMDLAINNYYDGTTTILLNSPLTATVQVSPSTTVCPGTTINLTGTVNPSGTFSYVWNTGATTSSLSDTPGSTQTYSFTAINTVSSCSVTVPVPVTVNPLPAEFSVNSSNICLGINNGTTLSVYISPVINTRLSRLESTQSTSTTYYWTPSTGLNTNIGTSVVANPTVTTVYTITAVNSYGCSSIATSTVTVGTPFTSADAAFNLGLSGTNPPLISSTGYVILWLTASVTIPLPPGAHSSWLIEAVDDVTNLVIPSSTLALPYTPNTSCATPPCMSLSMFPGYNFPGTIDPTGTSPKIGTLYVEPYNGDSWHICVTRYIWSDACPQKVGYTICRALSSADYKVLDPNLPNINNVTGINAYNNASSLSLYPNPSNKMITIETKESKLGLITIYNTLGQQVFEMQSSSQQEQVSVETLGSGVYTIFADGKKIKFVKQ